MSIMIGSSIGTPFDRRRPKIILRKSQALLNRLSRWRSLSSGPESLTGGKPYTSKAKLPSQWLLYAVNDAGVHVSADHGQTWRPAVGALPGSLQYLAVACSREHPQFAYVGFQGMRTGDSPKGYFGIA